MPSRYRQAGNTLIWLIVWLVGMAAIAYWCVARHVPALQQQIVSNAQAAVFSANANDIAVTVEGRTATLEGVVATDVQKQQLIDVVADADGVRHVNDQLTVAGQTDAGNAVVAVTVDAAEGSKSADATVPTAQNDTIIVEGAVEGLVEADTNSGEAQSADETTVELTTETNETANQTTGTSINEADEQPRVLDTSIEASAEPLTNITDTTPETDSADSELQVAELALSSDLPAAEETKSTANADTIDAKALALIEQARKESANSLIDPQTPRPDNKVAQENATSLTQAQSSKTTTALPSLKAQINEGTLTLTGELSSEDSLLTFIRSAMNTFDANYVVNSVQVNDNTAKADWLPALNTFLPEMRSLSNAGIDIIESQITLSGEAANDTQHDQVVDKALAVLSDLSLVERISVSKQASSTASNISQSNDALNSTPTKVDANTDPQTQVQALRAAYESLDTDKILFESSSDVLTEDSLRVIEAIAVVFAQHPSVKIEIDGHTDASGISANNLKLSQLRANAVRDHLVKQGIAADRISAYGFGDGVPIADNSTAAGRRLNRRIEFNF